jgi:hypothetical protein
MSGQVHTYLILMKKIKSNSMLEIHQLIMKVRKILEHFYNPIKFSF